MNLFAKTEGLLHISKIDHERFEKVDVDLNLGDTIKVKVTEIDDHGKINVSAKALLPKPKTNDDEKTAVKEVRRKSRFQQEDLKPKDE